MQRPVLWTALTAAAVFSFMLALNHFMPLHRDDYDYLMVWKTGVPIASLSDVFSSAWDHYLLHGGRMMTVLCLDLFLWLGKPFFDAANAFMFLSLVLLITMHARRSYTFWRAPKLLAAAALLMWLCFPHFGEVAVWKSGSTVYLWSAVPAFLFLLPYNIALRRMDEEQSMPGAEAVLPMLLLGICAGWSVENLAVTVVVTSFGVCLYARRRYGFRPPWMIAGALGALIGFIGLVGAPGNYVRYAAQGSDKGILTHIGNQFAEQGEMMLYLLPVLLLILTAWRLYRQMLSGQPTERHGSLLLYAGKKYVVAFNTDGINIRSITLVALISLLTLSYLTSGWVAGGIRDAIIGGVLTPLGFTKPKTIHLFTNLMNGFEEMAIYWFTVLLFYVRIKQKLGLTAAVVRTAAECVPARDVLRRYPAARYAAFLMGLGICNNLVMLAAPTFPGRAAFSSAAMFVAAALALLGDSAVMTELGTSTWRTLRTAAFLLFAYTGAAALLITHEMGAADAARIAQIENARACGETIVRFPRIERTNRALRHVYYEDWDNNVTKEGAMEYFGLTDVVVEK
jgi:hypothetical protein